MNNQLITDLLILLGGVFFLIFGFSKKNQRTRFLQNGIKTDGIVFRVEKRYDGNSNDASFLYYPVVRYLTEEKEWITEEYDIGTGSLTAYKEGDKVIIIYDSMDHTKFIINDTSTKLIGPIFIIIGIALVILSIVCYFFNISISHS